MDKYITYYRVSTKRQGLSGLGLEAQKRAVSDFLISKPHHLVGEYTEVESGKKSSRPQLDEALRACKLTNSKLLIAKLDRLSRNLHFITSLQESGIEFTAVDMPEANTFTVNILGAMAEYERELISARTKSALRSAKERGVRLGNPSLNIVRNSDTSSATQARINKANDRAEQLRPVILDIRGGGKMTLSAIAQELTQRGILTSRGNEWTPSGVSRLLKRIGL